jgi:hypothetical protein
MENSVLDAMKNCSRCCCRDMACGRVGSHVTCEPLVGDLH